MDSAVDPRIGNVVGDLSERPVRTGRGSTEQPSRGSVDGATGRAAPLPPASRQRTSVNTTCKLLLRHAFDTLGCKVVGLRTDNFNFRSQRAIEALGAKRDGVIRHFAARKDGTVEDTVMYSILVTEWPDVRRHLELRLARHAL
jgi:RimJ/RimL family protein N-acetyltransferase